jgi:CheY-like chemotaxis protein/anti-sigma regulatory factor (Ser/Thr protein kinase)
VWIHADETRMEQVVQNLVGNALKYTRAGGRIHVRVAADGDEAVLEVVDTGIGIPPELLASIFDPFVQGDQDPDRAQGGLGLGLTLVKALTELHGGTVRAESPGPGKGSVFTVRLPRIAAPKPPPGRTAVSGGPRARRRILVIEDNADAREMLRMLLTLAGHEVHEAADGPAGLVVARTVGPDVALIDVGLPALDGYEVARRLRAAEEGKAMRLIAITGYGQADDRQRARQAGFDAHLTKPVSPERLAAAMDGDAGPA